MQGYPPIASMSDVPPCREVDSETFEVVEDDVDDILRLPSFKLARVVLNDDH